MTDDIDWKAHFLSLYEDVAACEAPEGTQVDDVLKEHQDTYKAARTRRKRVR